MPVTTEAPLFDSAITALQWAFSVSSRNGYTSPSVARMAGGSRPTGERLSILDQHAQAAMIFARMDRLPAHYKHILVMQYAPVPVRMRDPETRQVEPIGEYHGRVMSILPAVEVAGDLVRYLTGVTMRRRLQRVVLGMRRVQGCTYTAMRGEFDGSWRNAKDYFDKVAAAYEKVMYQALAQLEDELRKGGLVG